MQTLKPHADFKPRPIAEVAADFLACKRIAVAGVTRKPEGHGANLVYQRLRERGYKVFAVNPNADVVEGDKCYHDLKSIPGGVEAVMIATRPDAAESTMRECAELGIKYVWMHNSFGGTSVSQVAAGFGRDHGISVIPGGCPLMFEPVSDGGHKAMRWMLTLSGAVPRKA